MGLCTSSYTFQHKLYELLGDIEEVKTYIDGILVLAKGSFYQQMYQIRVIFSRLHKSGLKVNATKCSFGLK